MPTFQWSGQTVVANHPRELPLKMPYPTPPRQPISSWPDTLARFQAFCSDDRFADALRLAGEDYVLVRTEDVPSGKLAALKTYVQANLRAKPECLIGRLGDWRTDGAGA